MDDLKGLIAPLFLCELIIRHLAKIFLLYLWNINIFLIIISYKLKGPPQYQISFDIGEGHIAQIYP